MIDVPVLMIVYQRADTAAEVLRALARVKPRRLYVAANAPDPARVGGAEKCAAVRALFDDVGWPCEVVRLFRTEHLNARESISSAISWFLGEAGEGIILEDDCVPEPSFFPYCAEMLERYRNEPRVMQIGANNFQVAGTNPATSYYFSVYPHIWGWATWRRAWEQNDVGMARASAGELRGALRRVFPRAVERAYWAAIAEACRRGNLDTWDYQWAFSMWRAGGLSVTPSVNLVRNIGFGAESTNTHDRTSRWARLETKPLEFPLRHPEQVAADERADAQTAREFFGISTARVVRASLAARMPLGWKRAVKRRLAARGSA